MSRPKLLDRVRSTYKYFMSGYPNSRRFIEQKKTPFVFPFGMSGRANWALTDYASYYDEGFNKNAVIYAAVMVKVRALSQTNLVAANGDTDNPSILPSDEAKEHPLGMLLNKPNKYMSGSQFTQIQDVFLNLTGNAFTLLERKNKDTLPNALWPIRPDYIQIIPTDNGEIKGYIYNPNGMLGGDSVPVLPENMMHVKLPNPSDELQGLGFGLSPISSLAMSADVDNDITKFIKMFFQRGAMPTGALKLQDMTLDDDSIAEIKERWMEVYGGSDNWTDIAVLDMTMAYEKIGMSFQEMDFSNLDQRNESRMLLPFGVPAELMPIRLGLEGSTFANKEEARRWFWEDTMMYELDLFLDTYKDVLTTDDGYFPIWDTSKVHALRKDVKALSEAAQVLTAIGVPPRIAFNTVGLQVEDYPGIETGTLPFNLMPNMGISQNNPNNNPNTNNPENDSTDDSNANVQDDNADNLKKKLHTKTGYTADQKQIIYKVWDRLATQHEKPFAKAAENAFENDRRHILAIVNEQKKKSLELKASVDFIRTEASINDYLENNATENWRQEFLPVMLAEIEDTGKFWSSQLGVQFNIRNIEGEEWFTNYTTVFANPITKNSNEMIHDIIAQAVAEGWSNDELANVFDDTFDYWITGKLGKRDFDWLTRPAARPGLGNRLLHWRKEMIARTETTRLANAGANNLFRRWGVGKKEWLATGDDRTRSWHSSMSGQVVVINEKFTSGLGNKLEYPGDPSAPLADTVQCRCTILPVIDKDTPVQEIQETQPTNLFIDYADDVNAFVQFSKEWEAIVKSMPQEQQDAFRFYTGSNYRPINQHLRGIRLLDESYDKKLLDTIAEIDKDFQNGLQQNTILKRGIDSEVLEKWGVTGDPKKLIGTTITDNGFMSTSTERTLGGDITIEIQASKGARGAFINSISQFDNEQEFLLPRGSQIEILDVIDIGTQYTRKLKIIARLL